MGRATRICGTMEKRKQTKASDKPISLAPLDFETAIRAAMATGKPPKAKRPAKKRKARK